MVAYEEGGGHCLLILDVELFLSIMAFSYHQLNIIYEMAHPD